MFIFAWSFNFVSMEPFSSLDKEHHLLLETISLYLIPDLAQVTIGYLPIREVLLREWTVEDKEHGKKLFPFSIAIYDQRVYVAGYHNSHIRVYDKDGKFLHSWNSSQEDFEVNNGLDAIAISKQGEVFVADCWGECIYVFSLEGKFLRRFSHGKGPLKYPNTLTIHNEKLYIADLKQGGVLIYSLQGEHLRTWEISRGYRIPEEEPFLGIAISPNGKRIYATDCQRVFMRDHERSFMPWHNSIPEIFDSPKGIAVSLQGEIYIVDGGNDCIRVFNEDGQFIREWGSEDIGRNNNGSVMHMSPDMIALSPQGRGNEIYVTDSEGQKIYVFRQTYF
jgi:hypothetical protein